MSSFDNTRNPCCHRRGRLLLWLIPAILVLAVAAYLIYPLIPSTGERRREAARKKIEDLGWKVLVSGDVCTITGKPQLGNDDLQRLIDPASEWDDVELSLNETKVNADGLKYLEDLKNLKQLDLTDRQLSDASLAALKGQRRLQQLHLGFTGISDEGLQHLAGLKTLRRLFLDGNSAITGQGLAHLAGLENMRDLRLDGTGVDNAGLQHLAGLKDLQELHVKRTRVDQQGINDLKKTLPEVRVFR